MSIKRETVLALHRHLLNADWSLLCSSELSCLPEETNGPSIFRFNDDVRVTSSQYIELGP